MTPLVSPEMAEIAERRVGTTLAGKWRIDRVLGAGGMATVYAATHLNNGRVAAIKLLHPELAANAEVRKRFAREGYIANKVGHPAAVAVLDDGVDDADGSVFLVTDLLVGQSLYDKAKSAHGGVEGEPLRAGEAAQRQRRDDVDGPGPPRRRCRGDRVERSGQATGDERPSRVTPAPRDAPESGAARAQRAVTSFTGKARMPCAKPS